VSKVAQTAYKTALQSAFFNLPESNAAVWTMASKAVAMAKAIREEGMIATIESGELKLTGGTTDRAKAMTDAKSLSALAKVAKGETGSNRATPSNEGAKDDGRLATPAEIMALAARLVEGAAKGEERLRRWSLPIRMPSQTIEPKPIGARGLARKGWPFFVPAPRVGGGAL